MSGWLVQDVLFKAMNVLALRHVHQRDLWSYHRGQQAAALAASNTVGSEAEARQSGACFTPMRRLNRDEYCCLFHFFLCIFRI